jgi:hypothetical protein
MAMGVRHSAGEGKRAQIRWWEFLVMALVSVALANWCVMPRHGAADSMEQIVARFRLSRRLAYFPTEGRIQYTVRDSQSRVYWISGRCRSGEAYGAWAYPGD